MLTALGENDDVTDPPRFAGANIVTGVPAAVTPVNPIWVFSTLDASPALGALERFTDGFVPLHGMSMFQVPGVHSIAGGVPPDDDCR